MTSLMTPLRQKEIMGIIPHRPPFLWVDEITELEPGRSAKGTCFADPSYDFFAGHFPGKPIMPGVLIIEAMAQAAIMLFCKDKNAPSGKEASYYLASVKVRFLNPVYPGDQLRLTVEPIKIVSGAAIVKAAAQVGDKEVASGELSFSVK